MTVTNVSTYGSLQTLLQNMSQVQNSLNTSQEAVSSGQASQTFDGLQGNIEQFVSLNAQVTNLQSYSQTNTVYLTQLQTSNTALGQMQTIATSIKNLIAGQLGSTGSTASFQQQLSADAASFYAALNTTEGGQYIYGGSDTTTPPVKLPIPTPQTIGTPDNSYYQGSSQDTTTRIADGQQITNTIRADNPAFQNVIAGIQQALSAATGASSGSGSSTLNTSALESAETLVSNGITGITALQATTNSNILNVQQVDTQNQTLQTYFTSITDGMTQADVVSLSTKVSQDQTVLEATYSVFARISQLTLANYLK